MNDHTLMQLKKELRQVGANKVEADELAALALKMPPLKSYIHSKNKGAKATSRQHHLFMPLTGGVAVLALGAFLVLISQSVLPTSWLYPVQKLSDNIAVDLRPQYRANIMMKRAQQVNILVADHASPAKVLATLDDYTNQATIYKATPNANYAAFEFCKTNLQQAAVSASPSVRQAIQSSLESLETT